MLWLSNDAGKSVALYKVAINHPGSLSNSTASKAVDGDIRSILTGSAAACAHTTLGSVDDPAWWRVDLEESYRILGIKIYNREQEGKSI